MLLLAMGLHARYVILDAEGLLPERKKWRFGKHRDEAEAEDEEEAISSRADASVIVHPPHGLTRPAAGVAASSVSQTAVSPATQIGAGQTPASTSGTNPAGWPVQRKLTKAERKALRKRLMKMKGDRQRRQRGG
jgi:hypothetical protein